MRMRTKSLALSALALTALAGCGGSAHKSAATVPPTTAQVGTGSATTAPATSAVTTSVPPTTASTVPATTVPSTTVPSGPPPCQTANLAASLGSPNGAAGTIYYTLTLTNKGSSTCTMFGYPGVSFVTGPSGTQVGAAATRTGGATPTVVTVAPSASAHATLGISEASNYGPGCEMTPVTGLRVYPPGQTGALYVAHTGTGCANSADILLHVGPVVSG